MKKKLNLPMLIMFIIIGSAALRNFDFETMEFKKFWLGMLYIFTSLVIIVLVVRPFTKKQIDGPQTAEKANEQ